MTKIDDIRKIFGDELKSFVEKNITAITQLAIDEFTLNINDHVKSAIENAINYYASQARQEVGDLSNKKISEIVKSLFAKTLEEKAASIVEGKINSIDLYEKVDEVVSSKLDYFLQKEIKNKVKDLISDRSLKINISE